MTKIKQLITVKIVVIISVVTILFSLIAVFFLGNYQSQLQDIKDVSYRQLNYQLDSITTYYGDFSGYIYDTLITDEILEMMAQAANGDETTKDSVRNELLLMLEDDYEMIQEYSFRQLHFHLPDSTSFLRMHRPEKYGDSLIGVRYSVEYANEFLETSIGFEEGKIFNGYRYVYPLLFEGEHVGSVEVSISLSTILVMLTEMYEDSDFCFVLDREVVESKVFDSELDNYRTSAISDSFLSDNETETCIESRNTLTQVDLTKLLESLTTKEEEMLLTYDYYVFLKTFDKTEYEISFLPLINIEGKEVGYFISVKPTEDYQLLLTSIHINIAGIFILYSTIIVVILIIENNRYKLRNLSEKDQLTGVFNRRKFNERLMIEISRTTRSDLPFSLIMFDIDHFKNVNDTHGHIHGDYVLTEIAKVIELEVRKEDTFARFGGEEFILILTNSNLNAAELKAEQIRKKIATHNFNKIDQLTVSIGVSEYHNDSSFEELLEHVDSALYQAKEEGRNRVVLYK